MGSAIDVDSRLRHHKGGFTHSTARMGKLEVVLVQQYETLKEARFVERRIKRMKRKDYIDKMVADGKIKIKMRE